MSLASRVWLHSGVLFAGGLAAGWFAHVPGATQAAAVERARIGEASFTSPFLEPAGTADADRRLVGAREDVAEYIGRLQHEDPTLVVSVYARDLLDGGWVGIDERRSFSPASLLKVEVLFYALARMDADPSLRSLELVYPGPEGLEQLDNLVSSTGEHMVPGESYRFDELVERMIRLSDNHAMELVLSQAQPGEVVEFITTVGVPVNREGGREVRSAQGYATLFRILYNSTYFSRQTSEYALSLLLGSSFREGLRAPLPPDRPVAAKFGVRTGPSGTELHECGIVYEKGGAYVVCVMTRSRSKAPLELAEVISGVSRLIYDGRRASIAGRF